MTYVSRQEAIADDDPLPLNEFANSLIESIGIATDTELVVVVVVVAAEVVSTSIIPNSSLHLSKVA
jgi:hypothetical protein